MPMEASRYPRVYPNLERNNISIVPVHTLQWWLSLNETIHHTQTQAQKIGTQHLPAGRSEESVGQKRR